jgi:hypothetical protein
VRLGCFKTERDRYWLFSTSNLYPFLWELFFERVTELFHEFTILLRLVFPPLEATRTELAAARRARLEWVFVELCSLGLLSADLIGFDRSSYGRVACANELRER